MFDPLLQIWARVRASAGVFGHTVFDELEAEGGKCLSALLARLEAVEKAAGITPPAPIAGESVTERAAADAGPLLQADADAITAALKQVMGPLLAILTPAAKP